MKTLFKISVLMLITSYQVHAQKETLYNKSYSTSASTTALLEFTGSNVEMSVSPDDKLHVEYIIEFINYPNRKKESAIENVKIESKLVNDHITVSDKSAFSRYGFFQYVSIMNRVNSQVDMGVETYNYKNESKITSEINDDKKPMSFHVRYIKNSTRHSESEKQKLIEKHNKRKQKGCERILIIKIPKGLNLTINSKASTIRILENLENELTLRLDGGKLFASNLTNANSVLKVKDATIKVNAIHGGEVVLDNSKRSVVGHLKNVKLNCEFSQLEIGKIDKNVEISDFNSKFWFHDFAQNFGEFRMITEYSEINMFYPKDVEYMLTTFGHDTVHYRNDILTETAPSQKNESSKMMVIGDQAKSYLNKININTVHGVIRFGEDSINF